MPDTDSSGLKTLFSNPWFYAFLGLAAALFFVGGLVTGKLVQPDQLSLSKFLDTEVPEWLRTTRQHPEDKGLGDPNAPVKIVEYTDLECPFCKRFSDRAFPKIVKNYVKTGKAYYTLRHFPLARAHPNALKAGVAAECAADQGKFWAFRTVALNNRKFLSPELIIEFGRIINLPNQEQFETCVENDKYMNQVQQEYREGRRKDVSGTPTVFIDGTSITGAQPYRKYREAIENALDEKRSSQ